MLYCFDIDDTLVYSFMRHHVRDAMMEAIAPGADSLDAYDRVHVLQGRREKIKRLALQPGARFALVTNQGGVAFGYQTVRQVHAKIARVAAEFELFYGRPFSVHVAFHHHAAKLDEWKCIEGDERYTYRKPGPGMLIEAMDRHRSDQATTWFVGDMATDEAAARAAGIKYFDQGEFFDGN